MKSFLFTFFLLIIVPFAFANADSAVIFSDGFENDFGAPGIWSAAGYNWDAVKYAANAHSGQWRAQIKGNTSNDSSLAKNISTADWQDITLSYWYRVKEKLEAGDHLFAEWSADGQNWSILDDLNDIAPTEWILISHSLPAEANSRGGFVFRFRANLDGSTDVVWLDDVELSGRPIAPTPAPVSIPTLTPAPTPVPAATRTLTPTPTPTLTKTLTSTATPKPTVTATVLLTMTPAPTAITVTLPSSSPAAKPASKPMSEIEPRDLALDTPPSLMGQVGRRANDDVLYYWLLPLPVIIGLLVYYFRSRHRV